MKIIIALRGKSNSGKTSSFLILGRLMIDNEFEVKEGDFLSREHRTRGRDFTQIFEKNGKRIGVASAGDLYHIVRGNLDHFVKHKCEFILCTCRSFDKKKPGTVEAIHETVGYEKNFVRKEREPEISQRAHANHTTAQNILDQLNTVII